MYQRLLVRTASFRYVIIDCDGGVPEITHRFSDDRGLSARKLIEDAQNTRDRTPIQTHLLSCVAVKG